MAGIIEVKDQGKLRIYDADNSHYTDIVVPSSVTANRTITLPDSSFTVPTANTVYTHPNHSGEVTSTADGATVIADNIVDEANLKVSNSAVNGYMLTAQSGNTGGLTWATAPTSVAGTLDFQSDRSGNLTVSAATATEIVFNAEAIDTGSKYNVSTGRYTPAVAGNYFVTTSCTFDPADSQSTAQRCYLKIRKNGVDTEYGQVARAGEGNDSDFALTTSAIITLDADDYISVWVYSVGINVVLLSDQASFNGFRLS
jgi:hypothetical protein